ncbi:unnamed protein product [Sphagnum jensenii]|jgi:hypothetical protein|uniref:F-box domain-containing protein n=1 Tax=Sphagnum jensenii TaxID=128206 RepID=A0ABP0W424_9BRYO
MTDQRWKRQKGTKIGSQTANESRGAEEVGDQKGGMEGFPVEMIGNILSHVANVKDVVRASMTCRKWREALRHLHTLQQDQYSDRSFYNRKSKTLQLEFLLLQTMGLQTLRILHGTKFSGTAVIAWLSHTGGSLRHLTYEVPMATLNVNMLERRGKMKYLESLRLRHTDIRLTTDLTAQRFMCLSSLTLYNVVVLSIANASWPSSY